MVSACEIASTLLKPVARLARDVPRPDDLRLRSREPVARLAGRGKDGGGGDGDASPAGIAANRGPRFPANRGQQGGRCSGRGTRARMRSTSKRHKQISTSLAASPLREGKAVLNAVNKLCYFQVALYIYLLGKIINPVFVCILVVLASDGRRGVVARQHPHPTRHHPRPNRHHPHSVR